MHARASPYDTWQCCCLSWSAVMLLLLLLQHLLRGRPHRAEEVLGLSHIGCSCKQVSAAQTGGGELGAACPGCTRRSWGPWGGCCKCWRGALHARLWPPRADSWQGGGGCGGPGLLTWRRCCTRRACCRRRSVAWAEQTQRFPEDFKLATRKAEQICMMLASSHALQCKGTQRVGQKDVAHQQSRHKQLAAIAMHTCRGTLTRGPKKGRCRAACCSSRPRDKGGPQRRWCRRSSALRGPCRGAVRILGGAWGPC